MITRDGTVDDVPQMSAFLKDLTAAGKRISPDDPDFVRENYILGTDKIRLTVADDNGTILGFQSLKRAQPGNTWGVAPGWGIIGTHIRPSAARRGVGRALFDVTLEGARAAGLTSIDASIGATNPEGQAYYDAMGFRTYRTPDGLVCKRYDL
ncbi:GNAT family N-acetyltransferase [Tateyamaria omphalii]|uniref:GNAT family N-acetyltransferase n=1 Tax=Tateyamaria omphalii TaxID=299262 RepID=A0A1P8MTM6_9RHOB|nr:GNAT family N-acetyltransferase [Tateyamaria omphalii]APX11352.1 GNAT family N-acetyltransferase [Tateyamaria omphalii]